MKKRFFLFIGLFFAVAPVFGQVPLPSEDEAFPSVDDVFLKLTGDSAEAQNFSLSDSIEDIVSKETTRPKVENTAATVRSAIEGTLVVEEVVPEVNREAVKANVGRYPPRLFINYLEFPLRHFKGRAAVQDLDDPTELVIDQSNIVVRDAIAGRIQARLRLPDVQFEFDGRTARLLGTVPTERHRDLAESMLRLEPGIDEIKNELIVAAPGLILE